MSDNREEIIDKLNAIPLQPLEEALHKAKEQVEKVEKKILIIKKNKNSKEYLMNVIHNGRMGVETTVNKDDALDISDWDISQLAIICKGLQQAGYKTEIEKIQIEEVEETKEETNETEK